MEPTIDRQACAARHLGPWAVELHWFAEAVAAVKAGVWKPERQPARDGLVMSPIIYNTNGCYLTGNHTFMAHSSEESAETAAVSASPSRRRSFMLDESGIAVIEVAGQMQKGESKFGGTSTLRVRRQIRDAVADRDVRGILLAVDSPGGTVAGTEELHRDVQAAAAVKPVRAHVDDLAASAAFWAISPTQRISASKTSEVGSIGTVAVVVDSSGQAEIEGLKVHVISTGAFKGAGFPGTEVTPAHLESVKERVQDLNGHFLEAVREGRGLTRAAVNSVADGRVFIASKAKSLGLIDRVQSFDQAMDLFRNAVRPRQRTRAEHQAKAAVALAEAEKLDGGTVGE